MSPTRTQTTDRDVALDAARVALRAIRRRWYVPVAAFLIALAFAGGAEVVSPTYQAQVVLTFVPSNALPLLGVVPPPGPTPNDILSDQVLTAAGRELGLRESAADLRARLVITPVPGSNQFVVRGQAPARSAAVRLADAVAGAFVDVRKALLAARLRQFLVAVRTQLRSSRGADRAALRRQLFQVTTAADTVQSDTEVGRRTPPISRSRAAVKIALYGLMGAIAGIVLTLLLALWRKTYPSAVSTANAMRLPLYGELAPDGRLGASTAENDVGARMATMLRTREEGRTPEAVLVSGLEDGTRGDHAAELLAAALARSEPDRAIDLLIWHEPSKAAPDASGALTERSGTAGTSVSTLSEPWATLRARLRQRREEHVIAVVSAPAILGDNEALAATQAVDQWLICAHLGMVGRDHAHALADLQADGLPRGPSGLVVIVEPRPGGTSAEAGVSF